MPLSNRIVRAVKRYAVTDTNCDGGRECAAPFIALTR
jgi:hypothetical protein